MNAIGQRKTDVKTLSPFRNGHETRNCYHRSKICDLQFEYISADDTIT